MSLTRTTRHFQPFLTLQLPRRPRTRTRTRTLHTTTTHLRSPAPAPIPPLGSRPGPPALPKADQEEFDALVRRAESGQFAAAGVGVVGAGGKDVRSALVHASQSPSQSPQSSSQPSQSQTQTQAQQHPDLRKHAPPQFEGDTNPYTGEVGGPKRDPFVAGGGDWQYSGRVTDF